MKKTFFYPAILCVSILAGFTSSCSHDDDNEIVPEPQQQELQTANAVFNLNPGSEWMYKRYENSESAPAVLTFSGDTDHVKVESVVNINGVPFSKIKHTITNPADEDVFVRYEYSRIDEAGHLVSLYNATESSDYLATVTEKSAAMVHPGADSAYDKVVKNYYGNIQYVVYPQAAMNVESKDYTVIPFKGIFTASKSGVTNKTLEFNYAKNIGLIQSTSRQLNGTYVSEERLVSYHLVALKDKK